MGRRAERPRNAAFPAPERLEGMSSITVPQGATLPAPTVAVAPLAGRLVEAAALGSCGYLPAVRVGVLGTLEVSLRGRSTTVAGPMPRRLLALLAVEPGRTLSADALIDGLWGDAPPSAARPTLQSHVARLRRALGIDTALLGSTAGYRLDPDDTDVDAVEFTAAAEQGRRELQDDRPADAALTLRSALALWRGTAYGEFAGCVPLDREADRLEQLRTDVVQWRIAADLADPHTAAPVAELEALLREYPTREGLWALLMRALYRAGRQADALDAYRRARELLIDELGVEPGAELRDTERLILTQDISLDPPQRAVVEARPGTPATQPASFAPERRVATVLAIELPGGAPDAEAHAARTRHFRDLVRAQVERFGGSVQAEFGDVVIAVFGAPTAHEDDPVRAVRAAHSIVAGSTAQPKPRAGLSTGDVVYSAAGVDGAPASDADRLRVHARPGDLLVDESTRRVLDAAVDALDVRVVPDVPAAWRLAGYGRSLPRQVSSSTPFVGRARDLDLLSAAVERTVVDRFPQLVSIIAEPGVGKTRLVDELAKRLLSRGGVAVYVARCLPYGDGGVLHPLPALVKTYAGITDGDSEALALDKIAAKIPPDEHDDLLPHLSVLIGGESTVTQTRREAFAAWARYFELMAEANPTVLVLEDVHWASPMLLDFTEATLGLIGHVPMLGVVTARPELLDARPNWGAHMIGVRLAPLGEAETAQLIAGLMSADSLPADHVTDMAQRCGGVPLYAEELARLGVPDAGEALPASLSALLGSRLDTLDEDKRGLLSAASLAGDTFWADQLADCMATGPERVTDDLDALVHRQFVRRVRPSRRRGHVEYAFAHELVRVAAEARLTRNGRAQRHLALAQWWAATSAERPDEAADLVAHHAGNAYDLAVAVGDEQLAEEARGPASRAAAVAGARLQGIDTPGALRLLERALALSDADTIERGHIRYWLGATLHDDRQFERAADELTESLAVLEDAHDPLRVDTAVYLLATLFALGRDWAPALDACRRAAAELPPSTAAVRNLAALAMADMMMQTQESLGSAIEKADRALTMADDHGVGGAGLALVVRGRARLSLGDGLGMAELRQGLDDVLRHEPAAIAIGARQWLAGALHHWSGPSAELAERLELAQIAAARGLQFLVSEGVAEHVRVLCELGRLRDAVELADSIEATDDAQPRWAVVQRALALSDLGELDEATVHAAEATPPADDGDLRHVVGVALVRAAHALADDRPEDAATSLTDLGPADRLVTRDGAMELLPRLARTALLAGVPELVAGVGEIAVVATPLRTCVQRTVAGLVAEAAGDRDTAVAQLRSAVAGWTELGFVTEATHAQQDLDRNLR